MKKVIRSLVMVVALVSLTTGCMAPKGGTPEAKRAFVDSMRNNTLVSIKRDNPELEKLIAKAPGYAVFRSRQLSLNISTRKGYGVVVNNKTGKSTYMKMFEFDIGLALGFQVYRNLIIFNTVESMQQFLDSGWGCGGGIGLAAKTKEDGSAKHDMGYTQSDGTYTLTDKGFWIGATVGVGRFWKYRKLNDAASTTAGGPP